MFLQVPAVTDQVLSAGSGFPHTEAAIPHFGLFSVVSHTDISDTDQTIYVPKLRTTIFDSENGSHNSAADEDITLIDTVRYLSLIHI